MASAQPPANAAPNTSAPIRIAAEMTVMTLGQAIRREVGAEGCEFMSAIPLSGGNLSEKAVRGKRQWTKKVASRVIVRCLLIVAKMRSNGGRQKQDAHVRHVSIVAAFRLRPG
jgi:hypothetical protein